jgi:pSer/pThr/pTyr-binding forkhead associated (FHA) protein/S1-C subfamily serine protease
MPRSTRRRAALGLLICLAAAVVLGVAVIAEPAGAATPANASHEKVSTLVEPSIVQLHATYEGLVRDEQGIDVTGGKPVAVDTTCSGFIVNASGYIATSGRCMDLDVATDALIDKAAEKAFKANPELEAGTSLSDFKRDAQREWTVVSPKRGHRERPDRNVTATSDLIAAEATEGNTLPVSVRRVRGPENGDVALVKVQAQDLPALQLATDSDIQPGIPSVSVGFRGSANDAAAGLGSTFEPGAIGAQRTVDGGLNRAFEVKAAISPAMSGGPTVDLKGRVLGVNRSRSARSTQVFGLMSPATEILQLLQDVGAPNDLGDASRAYRAALDAFFRGDRGSALAGFDRTLKLQPELKQAEQFRNRAEKLPVARAKEGGGWSEWCIALLSSPVVAALIGLVIRFWRRNRPDDPTSVTPVDAEKVADDAPSLVLEGGRRVAVGAELVIGRRKADLALNDSQVSRRHAVVRPIEGGMEIEDLGSANGTTVNDEAIKTAQRLRNDDVVQIGRVRLTAQVPASHRDITVLATDAMGPHVVVTRGPLAGRCYSVDNDLIIGRQDADLMLDHPQVSRRHAVVRAIDGQLEIEDLASANGTFVNGSRVDGTQRLQAGDGIAIGPVVLEARIGDEPEAASDTVMAA